MKRPGRAGAAALLGLALLAAACAPRKPTRRYGVYHVVERGETLHRIAIAYDVPLRRIVEANRLRDADRIDVGQKILIPGARWPREVGAPPDGAGAEATPASGRSTGAEAGAEAGETATARPAPTPPRLTRPLQGPVTSGFGARDGVPHTGIDIRAPKGTPVGAAAPGTVKWTGEIRGYGRTVILDHGGGVATVYAHLDEILVDPGTELGRTEPLGRVGETGRATSPHLHLELRLDGVAVDPLPYLP